MFRKIFTFIVALSLFSQLKAQEVLIDPQTFPDENFRNFVATKLPHANPDFFTEEEAAAIDTILCTNSGIGKMQGIEQFKNLRYLACDSNQIESLDVSSNTALKVLMATSNQLSSLNIAGLTSLRQLRVDHNQLAGDFVIPHYNFQWFCVGDNQITGFVNAEGQRVDLNYLKNATMVYAFSNPLDDSYKDLDLSGMTKLKYIYIHGIGLNSINFEGDNEIYILRCEKNNISDLDVSQFPNLTHFYCNENQLSHIDVSKNPNLRQLICNNNPGITHLDVTKNTQLVKLYANDCALEGEFTLNSKKFEDVRLHNNPNITAINGLAGASSEAEGAQFWVYASSCNLTSIDVSDNPKLSRLFVQKNKISSINIEGSKANLEHLYYGANQMTEIVPVTDCPKMIQLSCGDNKFEGDDLTYNVSNCPNLAIFSAINDNLTHIDLTHNPLLKTLNLAKNNLTSLDLSLNKRIETLNIYQNKLTALDVTKIDSLVQLSAYSNSISSINLENNKKLKIVSLGSNHIPELNISHLEDLEILNFYSNDITELDLSNNHKLKTIKIQNNHLSSIDISACDSLKSWQALNQKLNVTAYPVIDGNGNEIWAVNMAPLFKDAQAFENFTLTGQSAANFKKSYNYDGASGHEGMYYVFPRSKAYKTMPFETTANKDDKKLTGWLYIANGNSDFNIALEHHSKAKYYFPYKDDEDQINTNYVEGVNCYKNIVTFTLNTATKASLAGTTRTIIRKLPLYGMMCDTEAATISFDADASGHYTITYTPLEDIDIYAPDDLDVNHRYDNEKCITEGNVEDGIKFIDYIYTENGEFVYDDSSQEPVDYKTISYTIAEGYENETECNIYCGYLSNQCVNDLTYEEIINDINGTAPLSTVKITNNPNENVEQWSLIRYQDGEKVEIQPEEESTTVFPYVENVSELKRSQQYFGEMHVGQNSYLTYDSEWISMPQIKLTADEVGTSESTWKDYEQDRTAFKAVISFDPMYTGHYITDDLDVVLYRLWRIKDGVKTLLNNTPETEGDGWGTTYSNIAREYPEPETSVTDIYLGNKPTEDNPTTVTYIARGYFVVPPEPLAPAISNARNHHEDQTNMYLVHEYAVQVTYDGNNIVTGVTDVNNYKEVTSVLYYDLAGHCSKKPFEGVNIEVTRFSDGSTVSAKILK